MENICRYKKLGDKVDLYILRLDTYTSYEEWLKRECTVLFNCLDDLANGKIVIIIDKRKDKGSMYGKSEYTDTIFEEYKKQLKEDNFDLINNKVMKNGTFKRIIFNAYECGLF